MNRITQLLQGFVALVFCSAFVFPNPSGEVDASIAAGPTLFCMNSTGISHFAELSRSGHEAMGASFEMESPVQGGALTAFLFQILLCLAEEEACFDVCDDQAEQLARRGDVGQSQVDDFRDACGSACWRRCSMEEEQH